MYANFHCCMYAHHGLCSSFNNMRTHAHTHACMQNARMHTGCAKHIHIYMYSYMSCYMEITPYGCHTRHQYSLDFFI